MVLTDVMTEGLTFIPDSLEVSEDINGTMQTTSTGFIYTIPADIIKELAKDGDVELSLFYDAELNKNAVVAPRDDTTVSGNVNEITLEYVNYVQTVSVDVNTTKITIIKYDSQDSDKTPIGGAVFGLYDKDGNPIQLYEVKPNEEYRLAEGSDSSSMTQVETKANKTITISGLDADETYTLKEIKAPDGYNPLSTGVEVTPEDDLSTTIEVANSKGTLLPNTGGIGTGLFYFLGGGMILTSLGMLLRKNNETDSEE